MKPIAILILFASLFSTSCFSLCAWTPTHCKSGTLCYSKGTASCQNQGCEADQQPGGHITIYDNGEATRHGKYDIGKSPADNCTEVAR